MHKNPPDFCKRHLTFASPSVSALPKVWIGVPLRDINGVFKTAIAKCVCEMLGEIR